MENLQLPEEAWYFFLPNDIESTEVGLRLLILHVERPCGTSMDRIVSTKICRYISVHRKCRGIYSPESEMPAMAFTATEIK